MFHCPIEIVRALEIDLDELNSFVKLFPKLTPATKAAIPRNRWSLMLKRGRLKILTFVSVNIPFRAVSSIRFHHQLLECHTSTMMGDNDCVPCGMCRLAFLICSHSHASPCSEPGHMTCCIKRNHGGRDCVRGRLYIPGSLLFDPSF